MKRILLTSLAAAVAISVTANDRATIQRISNQLQSIPRYDAVAVCDVELPSAADDITYTVRLSSQPTADDTLSPCDYLIRWSLQSPDGTTSEGFSAYENGMAMRYRAADKRLVEYHFGWDSIPFQTRDGGVQRNAQFVNLLPQYLGAQLDEMLNDSVSYSYTVRRDFVNPTPSGVLPVWVIEGAETRQNYCVRQFRYDCHAVTGEPVKVSVRNNPGSISEQTVTATYDTADPGDLPAGFDEASLMAMMPEVFTESRDNNYRFMNLPGSQLPSFALPTLSGDRHLYERGKPLDTPSVMVFVDPGVDTAAETIGATREALRALPFATRIFWVFNGSDIAAAEELTGVGNPDETVLLNGKSLIRDCGVTAFPAFVFVNRNGVVQGVKLGFNKQLRSSVIEKATLLQP